ncbi:hypothetical protein [Fluviispira multicolorata]|uniref:Uncharacterized protein n=1 Tax=Fluviispira multicolorata TaxID=2654512 RepID=A0A833JA97_9BACT|nr:hypothetical protein [Fluviispira multicolorata]KAB8027744.1 hypothetical protein GCL57_14130 [Fluviispira multicolorata]
MNEKRTEMINTGSREQILKGLVYDLNEFIKKVRRCGANLKDSFIEELISLAPCQVETKTKHKCEGFILDFNINNLESPYQYDCICKQISKKYAHKISVSVLKRLDAHWPLKRGMVDTKNLAWQFVNSSYESVQMSIAFMIKCGSVEKYRESFVKNKKNLSRYYNPDINDEVLNYFGFLYSYEEIFLNKNIHLFFWNDIKIFYKSYFDNEGNKNFERQDFVKNILPKKRNVVLCFEETIFRLRSGTNAELFAFEQFLNDMTYADNALIVFSTQKLLQEISKNESYYQNYSFSYKRNLDELKISLQQAMEPDFKIARDERFVEPNRVGSFDRIIELLSKGQKYIEAIEKDYAEWKIKVEN